jgi:hypothetical protein
MTKRRHTKPRGQDSMAARGLHGDAFPALRAFLRGYLHQDFGAVHGSVRAAAHAFLADASPAEREQLTKELESLARLVATLPARPLRQFVEDLGSGWMPASRDEIKELIEVIRG